MIDKTFHLENGLTIKIETVEDYDADFSWLGRYTNNPNPVEWEKNLVVERKNPGRHEYRYFVAPDWEDERKYVLQDFERMEAYNRGEWSYAGLVVTIVFQGVELGSSSLWGVETDSGEEYLKECSLDLVHDAWGYALDAITCLKRVNIGPLPPDLPWEAGDGS